MLLSVMISNHPFFIVLMKTCMGKAIETTKLIETNFIIHILQPSEWEYGQKAECWFPKGCRFLVILIVSGLFLGPLRLQKCAQV
jgi:hypothetical protein